MEYVGLDVLGTTADILTKMMGFDQVYVFDPIDELLTRRLLEAKRINTKAPTIEFLHPPNFGIFGDNEFVVEAT